MAIKILSKRSQKDKVINLSYSVPISENANVNNQFIIKGIAINETTTGNNHKFLADELKLAAGTLKGVPLLVDHDNSISAIKGRVIESLYDESNKRIPFAASVMDNTIKEMIKDGRINSVSVGAVVKEIEEDNGTLIPRGITFKELSLVAVPADPNATFTFALTEAYKKIKEDEDEDEEIEVDDTEEIEEQQFECPECGKKFKSKEEMKAHKEKMHESHNHIFERRLEMDEQKEKNDSIELTKQLEAIKLELGDYKLKERNDLEAKYKKLCIQKSSKSIDTNQLDSKTLNLLISQLETIEEKVEKKVDVQKTHTIDVSVLKDGKIVEEGRSFTYYY